ncbi:MBL fold metallo-hydrolase [Gammaproteobacteria bacterium]|jgi:7,8-dihydropterin-6-yl-methyl-4-(beta-D-ribofuranosyl)aminobenzene 5'-phosphate synthase|nr:MBL fold metallo-hydrolase [Pseudomonadota bacterium]MDB9907144.1 MBL fold metallo-hydrolase [Gammaproteobacteria bacterium]|tara:strand:- start:116 stop:1060 length:945 start_codon:yes stop_codon:yes gene_type:complete
MRFLTLLCFIFSVNVNANYEITVLATNISNYGGFGEWSFSALYESDKESILFDTGFHEDTVIHNAKVLNKDLSKVEKVILSHYHSDHTGGLIKLRNMYKKINEDAFSKVYVARGFFNQRYTSEGVKVGPGNFADANDFRDAAEEAGVIFIILDKHLEISKNLYATGTVSRTNETYNGPTGLVISDPNSKSLIPDIILDDQSAGMLTENGWVMMSGCGHSGIINTAKKLQSIKDVPIYGAIGGFHLFKATNEVIDNTANWLKDAGMTKFMGGHCTGIYAAERVADIIGISRDNLSHTAIGSILTKDLSIIRSSVE